MGVSLEWPSTPSALLLWAQMLFAWFVIHYLITTDRMNSGPVLERPPTAARVDTESRRIRRFFLWTLRQLDPDRHYYRQVLVRILGLAGVLEILVGFSAKSVPLVLVVAVLSAILLFGRARLGDGYGLIGGEIGLNASLICVTGFLIGDSSLLRSHVWISLPISNERLACLFLGAASLIYLGKGGTYIVRGFLVVAGTMPRFEGEKKHPMRGTMELQYIAERDVWLFSAEQLLAEQGPTPAPGGEDPRTELRRGRLIGNMERIVLALLAAVGSYPAIGFLVAAKGLVRSKEFEDRDYAEYFLVGTLASTALALGVGTALRLLVNEMWK